MKKLPAFLQKHCGALLAGTLAVLLAFALGWYGHADYVTAQKEANLCDQLRWLTEEVYDLQHQYNTRARTGDLDTAINDGIHVLDLGPLRLRAVLSYQLFIELNDASTRFQPEVSSYLMFLCDYLQAAQYPDYRSLESLFTAAWPLTSISYSDLNEAMDAVYKHLSTEEGRAALAVMGIS